MTPEHLDDETLSALLDGEPPDEHVGACAVCQARLQALAAVAAAVASPVTGANPARRQAHINAALAAGDPSGWAPPAQRSRTGRWLTLAAAAVLVAGAAVGVGLTTRGHHPTRSFSAARAGPEAAPSGPSGSLADLGPQHNLADVAALLRRQPFTGQPTAGASAGAKGAASGGAGPGEPAPNAASPPAASGPVPSSNADRSTGGSVGPSTPCSGPPPVGQILVASAFLSWNNTPAVVFAYSADATTATWLIQVRALSDCSILAAQTIGSN